jgi:hypothetical protein
MQTQTAITGSLTAKRFFDMADPFYDDLIAYYKSAQDAVLDLIDKAEKEKWTVERTEHEINKLFSDGMVEK